MASPVGALTLIASPQGLHGILWETDECPVLPRSPAEPTIVATRQQLQEYFEGKRKIFDLPLAPTGTDFQIQAWNQLLHIPYGHTRSYGEQAAGLGDKKKARAVGMANGRNPISIVIPCHRVIGSNGALVGFGGGLDIKAILLRLEAQFL